MPQSDESTPRTVYLLMDGDMESRHVVGVFSTHDQAEAGLARLHELQTARRLPDGSWDYTDSDAEIEERALDDLAALPEGPVGYRAFISRDGSHAHTMAITQASAMGADPQLPPTVVARSYYGYGATRDDAYRAAEAQRLIDPPSP